MTSSKDRLNIILDEAIKWSLYAIVFAAPFSKSISEIGITVAIVAWAVRRLVGRDMNITKIELGAALAIYVITIIPSFLNSDLFALSLKALFTKVLKYVFLCIVMTDTIRTKERLKDIMTVAFMSIVLILADGLLQHYTTGYDVLHSYPSFQMRGTPYGDSFFRGYPTASFPFPNDLAAWILLMLIPLACVTIFYVKKSAIRSFAAIVTVGLFYLFYLAKVRSAWIALGVSMIYIAISKSKIWIILLLFMVVAGSLLIKSERTQSIFATGSFGDRVSMLDTSWQVFTRHPVIGNGLNTFFVNFKKYRNDEWKDKKGSYAHNCYLQMAADVGVVGLAGFLFLIFSYFRAVIRAIKTIRDDFFRTALWGISIGIFAFLVHSFFDTNLYSLNLATLFWFNIGLSLAMVRMSKTTGL